MARTSKKRFGLRLYILAIVLTALVAVAVTIGIIINSGARYTTYPTSEHGDIRFVGKVDKDGVPTEGTVYYSDGLTAEVSSISDKSKQAATSSAAATSAVTSAQGENKDLPVYKIKLTYSNGDVYEGETVYFLRHGVGTLTFSGGDRYEGEFVFDSMDGEGSYYYLGGDVYTGEFAANQKNGRGIFTWSADDDGSYERYEGEYKNDLRSGDGVYTYADGSRFEGSYLSDAKNGSGKMVFANGDVYEGDFVNDYRTGEGSYTWASGDKYVGEFYRNAITGYGTYTWTEGTNRRDYTGYFENGKIVLIEEEVGEGEEVPLTEEEAPAEGEE